jgi:hypothetical protein
MNGRLDDAFAATLESMRNTLCIFITGVLGGEWNG